MKPLVLAGFALFLLGVAVFIAQMWWHVWPPEIFLKILITDGCVLTIVFVLSFLIKEHDTSNKIGGDELK